MLKSNFYIDKTRGNHYLPPVFKYEDSKILKAGVAQW